jgi:protein-S-isoprenylcysteine O-methyltransferase Ste14
MSPGIASLNALRRLVGDEHLHGRWIMVTKLIIQTLMWFGATGVLLFVSAGTLDWPAAWVFLVGMVGLSLLTGVWLARRDPALVAERLRGPLQKGQSAADKIVLTLILLFYLAWFVVMPFDAVRFGWSCVPRWVQVLGALCILLSIVIGYRTMRENSFAAPVVKIQKERGHTVITTGPYSHVRHPMYAGAIIFFIGVPLLLGSWWGLAFALALAVLLAIRISIEERALREGLEGYDAYAARVRYRLIPMVW